MSVKVLAVLGSIAKTQGVKFASFTYTAKESGEKSKILVTLGASVENVYRDDIKTLDGMIPNLSGLDLQAAQEIRESLIESLAKGIGNNDAYVHGANKGDTYETVQGIPGVMVHKETGEIYVKGLIQNKTVLVPGNFKEVKSRPLTLAKKALDKGLRRGKIRQYALANITTAKLNGDTIDFS